MKCQKHKFALQSKVTFLNCAMISPMLKKVEKAGIRGIKIKRKPHYITGDYFLKEGITAKILFSKLIGNPDFKRCAIIPSTSYGIANVAKNLPKKKGKIIITKSEFPSDVYVWKANKNYELKIVGPTDSKHRGQSWNQEIIDAIDDNTAAVNIGNINWEDGTIFKLKDISEKAKKHNVALIIDGTQSIGAMPLDFDAIKPDALICSAYKWLLGPYSIGVGYYGEMFDNGDPIEYSWLNRVGSSNLKDLTQYVDEYQEGAMRYQVGEHANFVNMPMMIESIKQLIDWTPEAIQKYCEDLTTNCVNELQSLGCIIEEKEYRASHLFGIRFPKHIDPEKVLKTLKDNRIFVSLRGDAIRISPHVYNNEKDIQKFLKILKQIITKN